MGHQRANVDRASESNRADSQQRDEHVEYTWRGRFAQIGREATAFERPDRYRTNLLSVFRERARLAIGTLAERGTERKSRDFEYAADSRPRRRAYPVWTDRI